MLAYVVSISPAGVAVPDYRVERVFTGVDAETNAQTWISTNMSTATYRGCLCKVESAEHDDGT